MAKLVLAVGLAFVLGFAAHRASICTVRAVAEIMSAPSRSFAVSIGKSMLWFCVPVIGIFALAPALGIGLSGWSLSGLAVLGGFVFGVGGAMNGGCAYATMARLVDGDGRMLAAIVGFALGTLCFAMLTSRHLLPRPVPGPSLYRPLLASSWEWLWAGGVAVLLGLWGLYEIVRLWQSRAQDRRLVDLVLAPRYRLSSAAFLMGLTGALLFLMYGAVSYTTTFELVIEGALGTRNWPSLTRTAVLVAVLSGMLVSTVQRRSFRLDWRPQLAWLLNLAGGALMGFGTALVPGGNDALILYGVPLLSPNAIPAFGALALGVAAGLLTIRVLFGFKAQVRCQDDVFVSDNWSRPIAIEPPPPDKT